MIRKRHDLDIQIIVSSEFADPWIYFAGRREDQDLIILQDIRRLGQSIQSHQRAPREMLISFDHYQAPPRWRTQRPQVLDCGKIETARIWSDGQNLRRHTQFPRYFNIPVAFAIIIVDCSKESPNLRIMGRIVPVVNDITPPIRREPLRKVRFTDDLSRL